MSLLAFDTLAYSESMQKAGFTREQYDAMGSSDAEKMQKNINDIEL